MNKAESGSPRLFFLAAAGSAALALVYLHAALPAETATRIFSHALLTLLFDGVPAFAIMAAMVGAGVWLVSRVAGPGWELRWILLVGAATGIGLTATLVLVLGLCGWMQRGVWITVLTAEAVAGISAIRTLQQARGAAAAVTAHPIPATTTSFGPWSWLWLCVVPFAMAAFLVAAQAPGYLWQEEGFGYDILEYHLQIPKEYFRAGHIFYAPHNVYANFPSLVEMLYLLCIIIWDGPAPAAAVVNYVHLSLAALTVGAVWVGGREWSPRAGIVAGVAAGTCNWLVYLSGLAYVENGLLFFGSVAFAAIIRITRSARTDGDSANRSPLLWLIAAGAAAGWACSCKYTGVVMFLLPLLAWSLFDRAPTIPHRLRRAAIVALAAGATFSPWLLKNTVMTGNPVFPLANSIFHAQPPGWDQASQARWDRGHAVSEADAPPGARLAAAWRRIAVDSPNYRIGMVLVALGGLGLFTAFKDATSRLLALVIVLQLAVWLLATHLFARFAVVLIPPLAWLGAALAGQPPAMSRALVPLMLIGAGWNLHHLHGLIGREVTLPGAAAWFRDGELGGFGYLKTVNLELGGGPSGRSADVGADAVSLLMVGDAKAYYIRPDVDYCVVFNDDPFAAAVNDASDSGAIVAWLRARGYTHVLVNWLEVNRLRRTYGYSDAITPDLFDSLRQHGLSLVRAFELPSAGGTSLRYVDIYAVAPKP